MGKEGGSVGEQEGVMYEIGEVRSERSENYTRAGGTRDGTVCAQFCVVVPYKSEPIVFYSSPVIARLRSSNSLIFSSALNQRGIKASPVRSAIFFNSVSTLGLSLIHI